MVVRAGVTAVPWRMCILLHLPVYRESCRQRLEELLLLLILLLLLATLSDQPPTSPPLLRLLHSLPLHDHHHSRLLVRVLVLLSTLADRREHPRNVVLAVALQVVGAAALGGSMGTNTL